MTTIDTKVLDTILALQLTIGWAGEKAADPERLGWWNTDLTDEAAGGDFFFRLLPKTSVWAGLELARQAALRTDKAAREKLAKPDGVWTLYHFGFDLDEAIQDRLEHHKRHAHSPAEVFKGTWPVSSKWSALELESFLKELGSTAVESTPAGRKIKKLPTEPAEAAKCLSAALLPLAKQYPLPYGETENK